MAGLLKQQMQPVPGMSSAPGADDSDAEDQADGGADEAQEGDADDAGGAPDSDEGQGDPNAQGAQGGQGFDFSPQSVQAQMKVPPQLQEAYMRVVTAGMKVMFAPQMRAQVMQVVSGPGDIGQKLGTAIAGLMLLLYQQSNKTMPPKVIIPAALVLLAHAVDALKQAGHPITPQDAAHAAQVVIQTLLQKFGVDPNKLQANIQQMQQQGGPQGQQAQQPSDDDESAEDPNEEASESPEAEQAEEKQGG